MPKQSLNLAENYVPTWDKWEVVREIWANSKDADPDFKMDIKNGNEIHFFTDTSPSFSELTVIGASTKRDDADSIGQFGEGFKLAILVATRMGGSIEVRTREGKMNFHLEPVAGLADRVLYVSTDARAKFSGCQIILKLEGVGGVISGKFLKDASLKRIDKPSISPLSLYSKGVFIANLKAKSLWDWNINVPMNRDRELISEYDTRWEIARILADREPHNREVFEKLFSFLLALR